MGSLVVVLRPKILPVTLEHVKIRRCSFAWHCWKAVLLFKWYLHKLRDYGLLDWSIPLSWTISSSAFPGPLVDSYIPSLGGLESKKVILSYIFFANVVLSKHGVIPHVSIYGITQFMAALIGKVMISHHIAAFPLRFSSALSCPLLGTLWPIPETIAGAIHPDAGAIRQEEMDPTFLFDTWNTKILWVCIQCSRYIEYQYITLFIYIYIMSCNSKA